MAAGQPKIKINIVPGLWISSYCPCISSLNVSVTINCAQSIELVPGITCRAILHIISHSHESVLGTVTMY